jgi:hypothetical protein
MNTLICAKCKGTNIKCLAWVHANTNQYEDEYDNGIDSNWCSDCSEHVQFEIIQNEESNNKH